MIVVLVATLTLVPAVHASASLLGGFSFPEEHSLGSNHDVPPGDQGTPVLTIPITLQPGEARRVSDQLTVTLSTGPGPEVDNHLECVDRSTGQMAVDPAGGGTNYPGASGTGPLRMEASLLLTAPQGGTFDCRIRAVTNDGSNTSYKLTALADTWPKGTWIEVDNFTADAAQGWEAPFCDSQGRDNRCIYLGQAVATSNPKTAVLYQGDSTWTAAPDAVTADLVAHMQITSCFFETGSCMPLEWGDSWFQEWPADDTAVFRSHLDLIQMDPSGQPCQVTSSPDLRYEITNGVHHLLVNYLPLEVHISAACGGSRTFAFHAVVTWLSGNPVKIDTGTATNANVIVTVTAPTTTVPPVTRTDQASAADKLHGAGLTVGTVTRVVTSDPPGLVVAQNAPAGTVEPLKSSVNLTVSLGAATVPALGSMTLADANRALTASGLVAGVVTYNAACIEPAHVIGQAPAAGTVVAPGSAVSIVVDSSTPLTCGLLK